MNDILKIGLETRQTPPNSLEPTNIIGKSKRKETQGGGFTEIGLAQSEAATPIAPVLPVAKRKPRHRGLSNKIKPGTGGMLEYLPGQAPADDGIIEADAELQAPEAEASLRGEHDNYNAPSYGAYSPEYIAKEKEFVERILDAGLGVEAAQKEVIRHRSAQDADVVEIDANAPIDGSIYQPLAWEDLPGADGEQIELAIEDKESLENIFNRYDTLFFQVAGALGSEEYEARAIQDLAKLNEQLVKELRIRGHNAFFDPADNRIEIVARDGTTQPLSEGFFDDLRGAASESSIEIGAGLAGAYGGAKVGARLGLVAGPKGALVGGALGGLIGGAIGVVGGSSLDYAINIFQLSQKLNWALLGDKVTDAAKAEVAVAGVVAPVAKAVVKGAVWPISKSFVKSVPIRMNKVFFTRAQSEGVRAHSKVLGVAKTDRPHIRTKFEETLESPENLIQERAPLAAGKLSVPRREMMAVALTQRGGERHIAGLNVPIEFLKTNADKTVKGMKSATDKLIRASNDFEKKVTGAPLTKGNLNRIVSDGNEWEYEAATDVFTVEAIPTDIINGSTFQADIPRLLSFGIDTYREHSAINPEAFRGIQIMANSINKPPTNTEFSNLIQVRKYIEEFAIDAAEKGTKHLQNVAERDLANIDTKLNGAVRDYIAGGEVIAPQWSKSHKEVLAQAAKAKKFKHNALRKFFTGKGVTEKKAAERLVELLPAIDGTGVDFLESLSLKSKSVVEGLFLKGIFDKHTKKSGSFEAMDFLPLIEDLNKVELATKNAQILKEFVQEYGPSMGNDVQLSKVSDAIKELKASGGIAIEVDSRAKQWLVNKTFSKILHYWNSDAAVAQSILINLRIGFANNFSRKTVEKLLKEPLRATRKSDEVPNALTDSKYDILELASRIESSGARSKDKVGQLTLFKAIDGPSSDNPVLRVQTGPLTGDNIGAATEGPLGKGHYVRTGIDGAERQSYKKGSKVLSTTIDKNKVATPNDVITIMKEVTGKTITFAQLAKDKYLQKKVIKAMTAKNFDAIVDSNGNAMLITYRENKKNENN